MLTPIASEASPRASRLDATSTSWTDVTPRPPSSSGIGAVKYRCRFSVSKLLKGYEPSRSYTPAHVAISAARDSARATRRFPCGVVAWSSRDIVIRSFRLGRRAERRCPARRPLQSVGGDVHRDGHAVRDHVEHC